MAQHEQDERRRRRLDRNIAAPIQLRRGEEQDCRCASPGPARAFVSVAAHLRDVAVRDPAKLESLGFAVQSYHTCIAANSRDFLARHFADEAKLVEMRSAEGILGGGLDVKLEDAGAEVVQAWADLMYDEYSTKEGFLGCADHLIAVLRKNLRRITRD